MVFAMTLQPGTHAMWLRYWLAAGGINPDTDVALITIPPPMMVANMRAGRLDGFCAGEPWNVRAIEEELGFTAVLSEEIWPDHPEKVLAFTEDFSEAHPNSVKAALKALHEASLWCDEESQPRGVGSDPRTNPNTLLVPRQASSHAWARRSIVATAASSRTCEA